jgi:membrane protease YdiL (CAAX protease family)
MSDNINEAVVPAELTPAPPEKPPMSKGGKVWYIIYPILLYFGVTLVVTLIAGIVIGIIAATAVPPNPNDIIAYSNQLTTEVTRLTTQYALVMQVVTSGVMCLLYFLLLARDIKKHNLNPDKIVKTSPLPFVWMFFSVVGLAIFFVYLANMLRLYELFPVMLTNDNLIAGQNPIIVFLFLSVVGPISEELLCRGLLFKRMRAMIGFIPSALISAFLFGCMHVTPPQIVYAGILGFIFAYTYEKYDSIIAPMFCHIAVNLVLVILNYTLPESLSEGTPAMIILISGGALFALGTILLIVTLKKMPSKLQKVQL